jgi:hypothetical protein
MIGRFLSQGVLFVVVTGLVLHFEVNLPRFFHWVGGLPGDLILHKEDVTLHLPFTTSGLLSLALCLLDSVFSLKR